jgi:hypothetical protein
MLVLYILRDGSIFVFLNTVVLQSFNFYPQDISSEKMEGETALMSAAPVIFQGKIWQCPEKEIAVV